jgi:hypothetical protein
MVWWGVPLEKKHYPRRMRRRVSASLSWKCQIIHPRSILMFECLDYIFHDSHSTVTMIYEHSRWAASWTSIWIDYFSSSCCPTPVVRDSCESALPDLSCSDLTDSMPLSQSTFSRRRQILKCMEDMSAVRIHIYFCAIARPRLLWRT